MQLFPREQHAILRALESETGEVTVADLAARLGIDQALVAAGAQSLAARELLAVREEPLNEWALHEAGTLAASAGLPERRVLRALLAAGRSLAIAELPARTGLAAKDAGAALRFLERKGWARKEGGTLAAVPAAEPPPGDDEVILALLAQRPGGKALEEELAAGGAPVAPARDLLQGRRELLEIRSKRRRLLRLTAAGLAVLAAGVAEAREVGQLTPELLASGEWRAVVLKAYDVHLGVREVQPGKTHPMQRVIARTRRAFFEMGFSEVVSPTVESAFWNFDALFQPQDHPAREMQDTFYLEDPARAPLPGGELVARVGRTHEDGGESGSLGWQYRWDPRRAESAVLRTHTTATTVRALAADPRGPRKVFAIGRAFRREAIDFKHLPVFHQVDGIIIDDAATFASLLGTLAAFYRKMGFARVEFRPDFFPYTEPSVGVLLWQPEKGQWFELGGAGIFRPEVTRPLGCRSPVLAWGLGLERIAMMRYGVTDMRALYLADLEWLKGVPLCR